MERSYVLRLLLRKNKLYCSKDDIVITRLKRIKVESLYFSAMKNVRDIELDL